MQQLPTVAVNARGREPRAPEERHLEGFLSPVVAFGTDQGLLLVDGCNRVAVAQARRLDTIEAEIRQGLRTTPYGCCDCRSQAARLSQQESMGRLRQRSGGRWG
jgi:hypothetical protein